MIQSALAAQLVHVRALQKERRPADALAAAMAALEGMAAPDTLSPAEQEAFVDLLRLVRRVAAATKAPHALARTAAIVAAHRPTALQAWALGTLALARQDTEDALRFLTALFDHWGLPARPNLRPEIGNLHFAYGEYDAALAAFAGWVRAAETPWLERQRAFIAKVGAFCGRSAGLLYPDCAIDMILEELAARPPAYPPDPDTVMTITNTLVHGGAERQATTLHAARARLGMRSMALVRSVSNPGEDFFVPTLRGIGVEPIIFGPAADPALDDLPVPALAQNARLAAAVALLPEGLRKSVRRIAAIVVRERPQAVLVRHIAFPAALACALAGVPRTLFYSGTIEPATAGGETHRDRAGRARRHTMRKLLADDRFVLSNVSANALASDLRWLGLEDGPFRPVTSAVDFAALDETRDAANTPRRDLGIGDDCFVLGGAFRLQPIKRPMLWLEVAALVAEALPEAHFIVIGDGPMRAAMLDSASARGLGGRLHMPGAVADPGNWYRAMDLHFLASEREGLSRALVEAQHFGVPVLAADVGGNAEAMLAGTTGILLPANADARGFADAALGAWRDTAWRAAARAAGPAFVHAKFDAERNHAALLALMGIATPPTSSS